MLPDMTEKPAAFLDAVAPGNLLCLLYPQITVRDRSLVACKVMPPILKLIMLCMGCEIKIKLSVRKCSNVMI